MLNFTNLLLIGYTAWKGFLKLGRGVVICIIYDVKHNTTNLSHTPFLTVHSKYQLADEIVSTYFLSKKDVEAYLQEWVVPPETITTILQAVDSYNPQLDMILLTKNDLHIEVDILQKSVVVPVECYQQVMQRWHEFSSYIS
ncbi:hypothetical protein NIES4071_101120 (plasmid) [Calothrix sp. NIES-4071]|nr:hypothetical protein NIES4071_101120 [Calothrix sp. NIES-4071]BAZ64493.1 hypothetical protein NIES4105_102260 [Calothrix sp. NIES-4105]